MSTSKLSSSEHIRSASERNKLTFLYVLVSYCAELLAPRPTTKVIANHPLSAVSNHLIQYIRSCPPYLEAFFSIQSLRTWWIVIHLTRQKDVTAQLTGQLLLSKRRNSTTNRTVTFVKEAKSLTETRERHKS
jgi:hypothetical protein